MHRVRRNLQRDYTWLIAWGLTLLLHAGAVLWFRNIQVTSPPPVVRRPEPIKLVFASPGSGKQRSDSPQIFTELPQDRADKAPKKPDFLSNVTSRARDRTPDGDAPMPRMQGETDAPMVKLTPDGAAAPATVPFASRLQPAEHAAPTTATEPPQTQGPSAHPAGPVSTLPQPDNADPTHPRSNDADSRPAGSAGHSGIRGLAGNSDINQPQMDNPGGNASLTGDISLNTTAWDYAPWIQRFGRQLMRAWIPPPAYSIGILKEGGWAVFELEISHTGKLLRLDLLEEQGHPSLSHAAESAIRTMGAIEPLPSGFPEPTLILRLRMIYPRIRPR